MKKSKLKNILIYSIILVLCFTAVWEYVSSKKNNSTQTTADVAELPDQEAGKEMGDTASVIPSDTAVTQAPAEDGIPEHVKEVMEKSAQIPDPNPVVGIGRGTDYADVTDTAIENAGGLDDIIKEGDVVLIKPNLCIDAKPDSPTTTDYRVVQEVAKQAKELGASRIIIAEGCFVGQAFNDTTFKSNLYNKIEGVEFYNINDCNREDCYELMPENSLIGKALYVPKVYMDADVVITVAKLKTHAATIVTLSLKNSFGAISSKIYGLANKLGLHGFGLEKAIVEINKIRRPDFAVIDGIVGGEGYGPSDNTPVESDIILASKDPAALDTVALTFMGFNLEDILHVKLAGEQNVGITDLSKIQVEGAVLDDIKMTFDRFN